LTQTGLAELQHQLQSNLQQMMYITRQWQPLINQQQQHLWAR
jgi:hypothetical protein